MPGFKSNAQRRLFFETQANKPGLGSGALAGMGSPQAPRLQTGMPSQSAAMPQTVAPQMAMVKPPKEPGLPKEPGPAGIQSPQAVQRFKKLKSYLAI